jgi:hypothetical protein
MLVHDILESESLSLDQLINILLCEEPCGQLIMMRDWLLSRGRAECLANGIFTTPATETTAVDAPQVRSGSAQQAAADRRPVADIRHSVPENGVELLIERPKDQASDQQGLESSGSPT